MTANDDFPRGWFISQTTSGTPSLALPAVPGVAHVLTSVQAKLIVEENVANVSETLTLTSSDALISEPVCNVSAAATNLLDTDDDSFTGAIQAAPGAGITVSGGALPAGVVMVWSIQGHDN